MSPKLRNSVMVLVLLTAAWPLVADEDWSNYDWSKERQDLGLPGETTQDAIDQLQRAVAATKTQMTMSAVGFDIPAGSTAETYLQGVAQVGGGSYYRAAAGGQLSEVMDNAALGRPPQPATARPVIGQLAVGRGVQDGTLQGAADHFPSATQVWVQAKFANIPKDTRAECVWLRDGRPYMTSERVIGGTGWVAFAVKTEAERGLAAGTYTVRINAGGQSLGEKQFTIGQSASTTNASAGPAPGRRSGESLVFCRAVEKHKPVGVATRFHDITQLLACYSFKQRPAGEVEAVWHINGTPVARTNPSIKAGDGTVWFGYRVAQGRKLRPGKYRLELSIKGQPAISGEATVTSSDSAG
jgi:hypothetical protein